MHLEVDLRSTSPQQLLPALSMASAVIRTFQRASRPQHEPSAMGATWLFARRSGEPALVHLTVVQVRLQSYSPSGPPSARWPSSDI